MSVKFGQKFSSPALHLGQVRSESPRQPTAARSPGLYFVTDEPTFVTRPTIVDHTRTRTELLQRATEVFDWLIAGRIHVHIGAEVLTTLAAELAVQHAVNVCNDPVMRPLRPGHRRSDAARAGVCPAPRAAPGEEVVSVLQGCASAHAWA